MRNPSQSAAEGDLWNLALAFDEEMAFAEIETLAGPPYLGRQAGSPEGWAAGHYIADRFAGVSTLEGVAAGGPVLGDALAYLGCRVTQRMETPDHWIIYAVVEQGKVADTEAMTAVHHRKVGTHY